MCSQSHSNLTHSPENIKYSPRNIRAFHLFFVIKRTFLITFVTAIATPFTGESGGNGLLNYEASVFISEPSLNVAVKNGNHQYR